jgi:hypothetical protein
MEHQQLNDYLREDFPDLFEWTVNQMGDLLIARMARKSSSNNLLNLQSISA